MQHQYIEIFATHIFPLMQDTKEENTCVIAMEFWSVFAREEHSNESNPSHKKFITGAFGDQLVQIALQNLCFIEETDEEANGVSEGAAGTLESIFDGDAAEF